jgi:hypothetical protein
MTMKFENFQDVGCEEKNLGTGKGRKEERRNTLSYCAPLLCPAGFLLYVTSAMYGVGSPL